ncbi:MAG: hypothetical protein K6T26_00280 [Alicyclobacillus sp.]|nr:hypothetical protein [Alicyclobacillus sp.]
MARVKRTCPAAPLPLPQANQVDSLVADLASHRLYPEAAWFARLGKAGMLFP